MSFRIRRIDERREPRFLRLRRIAALAFLALQPLFALGRKLRERREREQRMKRVITVTVACLIGASIILLTFSLLLRIGAFSLSSILERTGIPLASDTKGRTNLLLLGQGDETHEGVDLTDSIMVASIDPRTESVVLLSLPRDLYFLHTEHLQLGKGKLNALWRDERIALQRQGKERGEASMLALRELAKEVGSALAIPMHYTVKVDFTALEKTIDALGGIDLTIPETIHDTEFPGPNYTYETFHIDAGPQHLDGATALKYARTRHTSSDFDRSARQQHILQAAAKKAQEEGFLRKPGKIWELLSILSDHLETDLAKREMLTLGKTAMHLSRDRIVAMQLNDVNGLYGEQLLSGGLLYAPPRELFEGASMLLPVSIPEFPVTWKQVRLLTYLLTEKRELYLPAPRSPQGEVGEKPHIAVQNAGAEEGSARRVARELIKFGFEVSDVGNFPGKQEFEQSFIARNNAQAKGVAQFFSTLLSLPEKPLPTSPTLEDAGDVAIILGTDFTFSPFQDLFPP